MTNLTLELSTRARWAKIASMRFSFNRLLLIGVFGVFGVFGVMGVIKKKLVLPPGQTTLLVLGIPGEGQSGADLTDLLMWVALDNQTGKVVVLSLPRDIWVPAWRTKLNSVYHYKGLVETKKIVSSLLGQETNYAIVVDYTLFAKVVDFLGGVEIEVKEGFKDEKYPIAGRETDLCNGDKEYKCRYETVIFESGRELMVGERVLQYVRSRHAEGREGTDFARAGRQQQVVAALVKEVSSWKFLRDPRRPIQLTKLILSNIITDLPKEKYADLVKFGLKYRKPQLVMAALDNQLLLNPPPSSQYDNQWVLVPKAGDWEEVQEFVENLLSERIY